MGRKSVLTKCLLASVAVSAVLTGCVQVFITAPEDSVVSTSIDPSSQEQVSIDIAPAPSSAENEASEGGTLEAEGTAEDPPLSQAASENVSSGEPQQEVAEPTETSASESLTSRESASLEDWITQASAFVDENRVVITPDEASQLGAAWNAQPVSLQSDVELTFAVYSGDSLENEYAGGDGMVFVLAGTLPTQRGEGGGGMGYGNLSAQSLGLELDTYPDAEGSEEDQLALNLRGQMTGEGGGPVLPGELEDGREHLLRVVWRSEAQVLEVYFDGAQTPQLSYQNDLVSDLFGGDSDVFYGFTGSTGGATNLQYIRPLSP